ITDGDDIFAEQDDPAGNTSPQTTELGGIDTTPPAAPVVTSPVDGALTNNNTPLVVGTAEPGSQVTVTGPLGETCSVVADVNGDWSCTIAPALADGANLLSVVATDEAGNSSPATELTLNVDTIAPLAPVIIAPTNGAPVTGTGEPGATVNVTTPSGATCSALVQPDGSWSCNLDQPPVDGEDISADQTDPAGNTSPDTTATDGIDTTPPAAPVVTSPADGALTNNNTPLVVGTAEPGSQVTVTGPLGETCSVVADVNGDWSCTIAPALADGANLLSVVATDEAGNSSPATELTLNVDTIAPLAPVIIAPTNGAPVTGTGEPGATVNVTTPSGATCSALVQPDGSWSCNLDQPPVNGEDISADQTDPAGNTSPDTTATGGIDTLAPADPVITAPADGITINDNTPTVTGTGEPGSTVTVTGPLGETCSVVVDVNGDWSCTISPALQDGSNLLTAVASDDAGNQSNSDSITLIINASATYGLVINAPAELVTTEMGGSDSFTVVLPLSPTDDVTVDFSSSDLTEGTVSPSSVTFTAADWDQPVTITVTGVDDPDYDLDQSYQVITSALSSLDLNYAGINPADVDAVNVDDDESPDLRAFITNCVRGVQPTDSMTYRLLISNTGNKDITGANVATVLGDKMTLPQWVCQQNGGASCDSLSGSGDLNETVDLPVGSSLLYLFDADVDAALTDFIDVEGSVTMPVDETDVNPGDNVAFDSDLVYLYLFKDTFDCAPPGTIESTNALLESLTQ
ncbi:Ig-like domain-containing protein, partial [Marinicella sediminis]